MNSLIKELHPETTEIITNAEHAFQDGKIDRWQRDEVIMQAIKDDTEIKILGEQPGKKES